VCRHPHLPLVPWGGSAKIPSRWRMLRQSDPSSAVFLAPTPVVLLVLPWLPAVPVSWVRILSYILRLNNSWRSHQPIHSPLCDSRAPSKTFQPLSMLMQLDASNNAGLTESQFRQLFVRCSSCKLFTTASAFEDHSCRISSDTSAEIIDLTGDD
jgi:hypothetical protein